MTSPQAVPCLAEPSTARLPPSGRAPEAVRAGATHDADQGTSASFDLMTRIRLLIAQEGSASAIARRCGCSEGAVRSWRDGRSDLSRTRCVTLARALGVSLTWLVAGEGPMKSADEAAGQDAAAGDDPHTPATASARTSGIDAQRLAATLRLLQSYVCMIGGSLNPAQRADAVVELYQLLGDFGSAHIVDHVIAFHTRLAAQLRHGQTTPV